MSIEVVPIEQSELRTPPEQVSFGKEFTNYMFSQKYEDGIGWHDAKIHKYGPFEVWPSSVVLHYAQEFFEGAKAYRRPDGNINLFRFIDNCRRFNRSAERMSMPTVEPEFHMDALIELITMDHEWVPTLPSSLYIRPTMIANSQQLGLSAAREYLHFIILSPVTSYFKAGNDEGALSVHVETEKVRAFPGGTGDIKAGGNYAASIYVTEKMKKSGYAQVLWLDGMEKRYVEEVGAMNIAFVYNGKTLVTPELSGTILPGITRDSILKLAPDLNYQVEETKLDINDVVKDIESGEITEVFGMGTAAVVTHIGKLGYKGTDYVVNNEKVGGVATHISETLTGIQSGAISDPYNWTTTIEVAS